MADTAQGYNIDSQMGGNRLILLKNMYGNFYKTIWKLILEKNEGDPSKQKSFAVSFAGCKEGDGASTMSLNFAYAYTENSSDNIVLIDGSMKKPMLHNQFNLKHDRGISDVITGKVGLLDVIHEITPGKFFFISAGKETKNPVSLFNTAIFDSILKLLREMFSLMIVDSPPLLGSPEAILLANKVDGIILVLNADVTRWEVAKAVKGDLEGANVKILGAILNKKEFVIPQAIYKLL